TVELLLRILSTDQTTSIKEFWHGMPEQARTAKENPVFRQRCKARRHEQFHCGREFLKQEITYCTTHATTCSRCTCDLHLVRSSLVVVQKKYFLSVFTRRKLVLVCRPV